MLTLRASARLFPACRRPAAIETAVLLGPGGEFAFVVHRPGHGRCDSLRRDAGSFTLAVTSLTMAHDPAAGQLLRAGLRPAWKHSASRSIAERAAAAKRHDDKGRAIVVGHGRVGQVVCTMLRALTAWRSSPPTAIRPPSRQYRRRGRKSTTAMPTNPAFLTSCGLP